jgi:hypothetical protein
MMKKTYVVVALALVLGGCASIRIGDQGHQRLVVKPDPGKPNILISSDRNLVIDQEPLVLTPANAGDAIITFDGKKTTRISWALPLFSNYFFPKDGGIAFSEYNQDGSYGRPIDATCDKDEAKTRTCFYDTPMQPNTKYKYSVTVIEKNSTKPPLTLDPSVWN